MKCGNRSERNNRNPLLISFFVFILLIDYFYFGFGVLSVLTVSSKKTEVVDEEDTMKLMEEFSDDVVDVRKRLYEEILDELIAAASDPKHRSCTIKSICKRCQDRCARKPKSQVGLCRKRCLLLKPKVVGWDTQVWPVRVAVVFIRLEPFAIVNSNGICFEIPDRTGITNRRHLIQEISKIIQ